MSISKEMTLRMTPLFGKIAHRMGYVNSRQLTESVRIFEEEKAKGTVIRLGQIMVRLGYLDEEKVRQVLLAQSIEILACAKCGATFNVLHLDISVTIRDKSCVKCGGRLALQEKMPSKAVKRLTDKLPLATDQDVHTRSAGGGLANLRGSILGGCEIMEKLGEGGMGVVYKAKHMLLNRISALKVVPISLDVNDARIKRFFAEAAALGTITSPEIVQVFNVGEENGYNFIEMEFVDGGTLEDLISDRKGKPFELGECLPVIKALCRGLKAAHDKNIVHRDVKPANILISKIGEYKIADFGIAKNLESGGNLTQDGSILGTPHYMSPEQCRGGVIDKRSDVYSSGVLFFYLLTGRRPFESDDPMHVFMSQMNEEVKPPKSLVPSIPISYSLMVEKMMAKAPGERYQDTGAVLTALEDIESGVQIAYTAMRIRRRRFRFAISATIFIILGFGLLAGVWQYFGWIEADRIRLHAADPVRSPRNRAEDLLRSARSLYESGMIDEVAPKAREAKETWPGLDAADVLLTQVDSMGSILAAYDGGDPARALELALEHERSFAGDPLLTALRAKSTALEAVRRFAREGRWSDAILSCDEILSVDPRDRRGKTLREGLAAMVDIERLENGGKLDEAVSRLLRIAPESVPDTGKIAEARGRLWAGQGAVVERFVSNLEVIRAREAAYRFFQASGSDPVARAHLDRTEKLLAAFETLVAEGDAKFREGEFEPAAARYASALEISRDPKVGSNLRLARLSHVVKVAKAAEEEGRFDEALDAYGRAREFTADGSAIDSAVDDCMRKKAAGLVDQARLSAIAGRVTEARDLLASAGKTHASASGIPGFAQVERDIVIQEGVPEGMVLVRGGAFDIGPGGSKAVVGDFYISVREVTNEEFARFVEDGGYDRKNLWDQEGRDCLDDFLDSRGMEHGPADWAGGTYPSGKGRHPVRFVSWYEADAYARWLDCRLPTRDEWMTGAAWSFAETRVLQFPWGDEWNQSAANVGTIEEYAMVAAVGSFTGDLSPSNLLDTAGNVSEWTSSPAPGRPGYFLVKGGSTHHGTSDKVKLSNDSFRATRTMRLEIIGFRTAATPGESGGK